MENLSKVNARVFLIWVSDNRRAYQNRADRGPFFKGVIRKNIVEVRELNNGKPYFCHAHVTEECV